MRQNMKTSISIGTLLAMLLAAIMYLQPDTAGI